MMQTRKHSLLFTLDRARRFAASILVVALALTIASCFGSCAHSTGAATLRVSCTAPDQANDGTCALPVLLPLPDSLVVHFAVSGRIVFEDSVRALPGSPVAFSRQVPAGIYSVRAWASSKGGASCDTTISVNAPAAPSKVRF